MKTIIIGGAGFIGSNLAAALLRETDTSVLIYDNFSSGKNWHLEAVADSPRLRIVRAEVEDAKALAAAMMGAEVVFHLASNPDISRAAREPTIDFYQGTLLTQLIVEAARVSAVKRIIYASGSGIFGDDPGRIFQESEVSPCPNSTYAASKIAGETLLSAYSHMFGMVGVTFRFANVVGPNQTHGVGYDFIRKLRDDGRRLQVLGDGYQSKSYIHVMDVVAALLLSLRLNIKTYDFFNLSTEDCITVRDIAAIVISEMKLQDVEIAYGRGDRGWKGDVPIIRFSAAKAKKIGWKCQHGSAEAMRLAVRGMLDNLRAGRLHNDGGSLT